MPALPDVLEFPIVPISEMGKLRYSLLDLQAPASSKGAMLSMLWPPGVTPIAALPFDKLALPVAGALASLFLRHFSPLWTVLEKYLRCTF